ncbi:hypothetical protein HYU22_05560 [Candidatus Woesearchaeota archaeon]|nr:hypothetical protein [Candidatus Woesearchaeota archaeon]
MCKLKTTLWINTVLFSLMALLHLLRLLLQWPAQIGSWTVPVWLSGVGVIVAGALVYCNAKHVGKA